MATFHWSLPVQLSDGLMVQNQSNQLNQVAPIVKNVGHALIHNVGHAFNILDCTFHAVGVLTVWCGGALRQQRLAAVSSPFWAVFFACIVANKAHWAPLILEKVSKASMRHGLAFHWVKVDEVTCSANESLDTGVPTDGSDGGEEGVCMYFFVEMSKTECKSPSFEMTPWEIARLRLNVIVVLGGVSRV
jgi:hypothetical protein